MSDHAREAYDLQPEALRLGVTGHRVLTDIAPVVEGVRLALARIQAAYPGRPMTVVSSLAEGADRIVAEQALQLSGARLVAVLPFAPDVYADDFGGRASASWAVFSQLLQRAFEVRVMPDTDRRQSAYALAGAYVVDTCDVLLAVWDGRLEQGHGGTGAMVKRARSLHRPLVIVRAGNRRRGTAEPTTLGSQQGRLLVERLPVVPS